jgi:transposase
MVKQLALSGDFQMVVATAHEPASEVKHHRRAPNALTFRLEYFPDQIGALPDGDSRSTPLKNWDRVFVISDRLTLEQFASVIIDLLAWDEDHLYEFQIADTVYVHMGDPDCSAFFVVDAVNPCVSCAIRLHYLNLSPTATFDFVFDFGRWHLFRLTRLEVSPHRGDKRLPFLVSHRGKNLHQYSGEISGRDRRRIEENTPTISRVRSCGNTSSVVRFVRGEDYATLLKWRESNDKRLWEKAVTVLENRNLSLEEIAEKIERPVNVLRRWIMAFNHRGMLGLDPPRKNRSPGKREAAAEIRKKRLLEILHDRPRSFGISRASWNRLSLAKAYAGKYGEQVSEASVSRALKQAGYSIKKARRVLTSPDPEYREKVEQVLITLQTLKPDELFFFIDELGPLRVKKYGGRTFAAKGDVPTVPQTQAHKGSITMAGALSATANQVTWFFSPAKDTQSMIDLIEILFNQHPNAPRIFLTWDAASWHSSASLIEWLDAFNAQTSASGVVR